MSAKRSKSTSKSQLWTVKIQLLTWKPEKNSRQVIEESGSHEEEELAPPPPSQYKFKPPPRVLHQQYEKGTRERYSHFVCFFWFILSINFSRSQPDIQTVRGLRQWWWPRCQWRRVHWKQRFGSVRARRVCHSGFVWWGESNLWIYEERQEVLTTIQKVPAIVNPDHHQNKQTKAVSSKVPITSWQLEVADEALGQGHEHQREKMCHGG
jgi:hypothetical protein